MAETEGSQGPRCPGESIPASHFSFAEKYRGRGLDLDDRISLGNIGFLVALDKFNIKLRWRLWTYAKHWVRAEIGAASEKSQSIVTKPRGKGTGGDFH